MMRRAITWALAAFLMLVVVGVRASLACVSDSEGLALIDGELPGGG